MTNDRTRKGVKMLQKVIHVVGFGSHGSAWTQCLQSSGWSVHVYLSQEGKGYQNAKELGLNLPNTSNAQQVFNTCVALGGENWDHSALVKGLEHMANFSLRDES